MFNFLKKLILEKKKKGKNKIPWIHDRQLIASIQREVMKKENDKILLVNYSYEELKIMGIEF